MALAAETALNSPQRRWDCIREGSNTRGVNCTLLNSRGYQTINIYIYVYIYIDFTLTDKSQLGQKHFEYCYIQTERSDICIHMQAITSFPGFGTYLNLVSHGKYDINIITSTQAAWATQTEIFLLPGIHLYWVGMGSIEWEVCMALLHMTQQWESNPKPLNLEPFTLSIQPYAPMTWLPHRRCVEIYVQFYLTISVFIETTWEAHAHPVGISIRFRSRHTEVIEKRRQNLQISRTSQYICKK